MLFWKIAGNIIIWKIAKIVKGISNTIVDIPDSVKIFILELDNELTWAIDTVFNVNLKLSKKEDNYLSYVQEHNRSHAKKADSSILILILILIKILLNINVQNIYLKNKKNKFIVLFLFPTLFQIVFDNL